MASDLHGEIRRLRWPLVIALALVLRACAVHLPAPAVAVASPVTRSPA